MELMTQEFKDTLLPWISYIQNKGGVVQLQAIDKETGDIYSEDVVELVFKKKNHLSEELSMTYTDGSGITVTWTTDSIEASVVTMDDGFDMNSIPVTTALEMIDEMFPST